jgi:hypothetical protein
MAEEQKNSQKVPPVADRLVHYARTDGWPLFVDQHGEAHTIHGGQAVPLARANRPLTELLYSYEEKAPTNDGLIGARRVLDMLAHLSGDVRELHTRSAFSEGAVFYELRPGRVVRIDERGWQIDPEPPVLFRAVPNLKPLPDPAPGGTLEDITRLVNLKTPRDKPLFSAHVALSPLPHIALHLAACGRHGGGEEHGQQDRKAPARPHGERDRHGRPAGLPPEGGPLLRTHAR